MEDIRLYKIGEKQVSKPNTAGYFRLLWVNKGTVKLKLDFKEQPVGSSRLMMILPDTEIQIETAVNSEVWVLTFAISIIKIDGRDFAADMFRLFVSHIKDIRAEVAVGVLDKIQRILPMLFDEYELEKPSFEIVWSYLKIILLTLIREAGNRVSVPDKNIERVHVFFALLNKHAKEEKQVTFYAGKLNLSTKRLNQILQSLTNKSASYFIQEHLIMEAKRELIKGDLSVNEIAYDLGFEDRAYFSRFFKRWTGVPPNQFKEVYFQQGNEKLIKEGILNYSGE